MLPRLQEFGYDYELSAFNNSTLSREENEALEKDPSVLHNRINKHLHHTKITIKIITTNLLWRENQKRISCKGVACVIIF